MRTILYSVVNTEAKKIVFTDCRYWKCEEFIKSQENSENLAMYYHRGFSNLYIKMDKI